MLQRARIGIGLRKRDRLLEEPLQLLLHARLVEAAPERRAAAPADAARRLEERLLERLAEVLHRALPRDPAVIEAVRLLVLLRVVTVQVPLKARGQVARLPHRVPLVIVSVERLPGLRVPEEARIRPPDAEVRAAATHLLVVDEVLVEDALGRQEVAARIPAARDLVAVHDERQPRRLPHRVDLLHLRVDRALRIEAVVAPALVVEAHEHLEPRIDLHLHGRIPVVLVRPAGELGVRELLPDALGDLVHHVPVAVGDLALGALALRRVERLALLALTPERRVVVAKRHVAVASVRTVDPLADHRRRVVEVGRIRHARVAVVRPPDELALAVLQREPLGMPLERRLGTLLRAVVRLVAEVREKKRRLDVSARANPADRQLLQAIRVLGTPSLVVREASEPDLALHVVARAPEVAFVRRRPRLADLQVGVVHGPPDRQLHRVALENAVFAVLSRHEPAHPGVLLQHLVAPVQGAARRRADDVDARRLHIDDEAVVQQLARLEQGLVETYCNMSQPIRLVGVRDLNRATAGRLRKILRELLCAELLGTRGVVRDNDTALRKPVLDERNLLRGLDTRTPERRKSHCRGTHHTNHHLTTFLICFP